LVIWYTYMFIIIIIIIIIMTFFFQDEKKKYIHLPFSTLYKISFTFNDMKDFWRYWVRYLVWVVMASPGCVYWYRPDVKVRNWGKRYDSIGSINRLGILKLQFSALTDYGRFVGIVWIDKKIELHMWLIGRNIFVHIIILCFHESILQIFASLLFAFAIYVTLESNESKPSLKVSLSHSQSLSLQFIKKLINKRKKTNYYHNFYNLLLIKI